SPACTLTARSRTHTLPVFNARAALSLTAVTPHDALPLLPAGFTNVQNLVGGSGNDAFTFVTGGSLTGTINGGGGTNTLTGDNAGDGFSLTCATASNLSRLPPSAFTNIPNPAGATATATFT